MPVTNEITVALGWDGRRVRRVSLAQGEAFEPLALLAGREPAAAVALMPRIYSVCAEAQGAAAAAASAAATGTALAVAEHERAVRLETVHEHLWRLLVDWPRAAGEEPAYAAFAPVRKALATARGAGEAAAAAALAAARELATVSVFGEPVACWGTGSDTGILYGWARRAATLPARLLDALLREHPGLGHSTVALMPAAPAALSRALPGIALAQQRGSAPDWDGGPAETGALARLQDHPLLLELRAAIGNSAATRMVARLLELALLLTEIGQPETVRSIRVADGEGVGAVQTARGLLLHRMRLAQGAIAGYTVLAPTAWNFACDGPLATGLAGLEVDDAASLEAQARLAVLALDPCVACRVEIGHA